jgi:molecular chaperone GrpE
MPEDTPGPAEGPRDDETPDGSGADDAQEPAEGSIVVPDDLSGLDEVPLGTGPPGGLDGGAEPTAAPSDLSVEALLDDVERLTAERDGYLDRWQRATADFENSKRRLQRDAEDASARASGRLAEDLLPVLDACDAAIGHGETGVEPVFAALLQILEKNGLERIDPVGDVFDPTRHEAVMHEPAGPDDDPALALVSEVLRIGYAWKGRVVRAAMVKVRG